MPSCTVLRENRGNTYTRFPGLEEKTRGYVLQDLFSRMVNLEKAFPGREYKCKNMGI